MGAGLAFDKLAARYDATWSETAVGRSQREAVWRAVDALFAPGDRILDLGCGTGVDALHFAARGIEVHAIDASAEMVRIARGRGVEANRLPIEDVHELSGFFNGAFSNFGPLNCVPDLQPVAQALGRLVRPRGYVAICVMGPSCAWEVLYYLGRLRFAKAFRRWKSAGTRASIGVDVRYPSVRQLVHTFQPDFQLVRWCGIGLFVPPSYVEGLSDRTIARLAAADRQFAHLPGLRALADHRLLIFQRGTP